MSAGSELESVCAPPMLKKQAKASLHISTLVATTCCRVETAPDAPIKDRLMPCSSLDHDAVSRLVQLEGHRHQCGDVFLRRHLTLCLNENGAWIFLVNVRSLYTAPKELSIQPFTFARVAVAVLRRLASIFHISVSTFTASGSVSCSSSHSCDFHSKREDREAILQLALLWRCFALHRGLQAIAFSISWLHVDIQFD